jgi:inosine-uridine nucleoside N-ribohydrolase
MNNPGKITLVATGPLTNIALTLQHHPEVARHLAGLILMGGAYGLTPYSKGNQTPYAEFNMWQDPEAAHLVFASGMNIHAIGLDISLDPATCLYRQQLQQLQQKSAPAAAQLASKLVDYAIKHHGRCEMHDPLALAAALDMGIFGFTLRQIKITRGNGAKRGVTCALIQKKTPILRPIYIANKVNGPRFLELFLSRIMGR